SAMEWWRRKAQFKGGGLLAKADRPMTSASYVNVKGLLEAIGPWVEYGLEAAFESAEMPKERQERILKQVRTGFEVLSVIRGTTSYTTLEGKPTVTPRQPVLRHLPHYP